MNGHESEVWSRATPPSIVGISDWFCAPGSPPARLGVPEIGTYDDLGSGALESGANVRGPICLGAFFVPINYADCVNYANCNQGAETRPLQESGRRTRQTEIVRTLISQRASARVGIRAPVATRQTAVFINNSVTWLSSAATARFSTHGATTTPEAQGGCEPLGWLAFEPVLPVPADDEAGTLARFQGVLETWKGRLFTGTLERVGRQLPYLLEDEEELAALSHTPDAASFVALLSYLAVRPWIKAPSLTLTRNGIFVANWRPAAQSKARLSVEFTDEKRVRWSAVDVRSAQASTMIGGICSVSDLDEHLRCYRSWFCL